MIRSLYTGRVHRWACAQVKQFHCRFDKC